MADNVDKDELIAQFQGITGENAERSRFYLESSNWQVDVAISAFYENGGGGDDEPMEIPAGDQAGSAAAAEPPKAAAVAAKPSQPKSYKPASNIATLGSSRGNDDDDDDDSDEEEEGQAFYAGGSDTSGQQILGPPRKKNSDLVKDLFKKAREAGAEVVEGEGPSGSRGGPSRSTFTGKAFKLGSDASEASEEIPDPRASRPAAAAPREFTLKMWSNGFSIDDGELREYNDPRNRAFLAAVMTGRIPDELIKEAKGGEVHVNMEDHKHEEYVKPKASRKPFSGQGFTLGSAAPEIAGAGGSSSSSSSSAAAPPAASAQASGGGNNDEEAKKKFPLDSAKPTTNLRIVLHDGSRLAVRMNSDRTVADLRSYITTARPALEGREFGLRTAVPPPKEIENETESLEKAGLLNAALHLKLK